MMLDANNSRLKPEYREARKVGNVQVRRAAVQKAEKLLGFKAETKLPEGLRRLIEWKRTLKPVAVSTEAR